MYYGTSVELRATRWAFYLAVQPGRTTSSWQSILVTGHLACSPRIFGSWWTAESPIPSFFLVVGGVISHSLSFSGRVPQDNCSALCGLPCLFMLALWPRLLGSGCHDRCRRLHNYSTQPVCRCEVAVCDAWGPISCDLPRHRCNSIVGMALGGAESGDIQQPIIHLRDCLSNW